MPRRSSVATMGVVGVLYLAALIIGLGAVVLQVFAFGDGDAGSDVDAHADLDAGADASGNVDASGNADGHGHMGASGFLPILMSLRFWTFFFAAFGLVGSLLHFLNLMDKLVVPFVAMTMALASGLTASWVFKALARSEVSSGATATDAVGQVGRVLLPVSSEQRGKVRIEIRGQSVDMLATTRGDALEQGDLILVEEINDDEVFVSRAPPELAPGSRRS